MAGGDTTYYCYDPNNDQLEQETTDGNNLYYEYDDNGSLIEEANDTETLRTYTYNYLNRLASFDDGSVLVNYTYSPDGIRTRAKVNGSEINYLIDPFNHTGYAQVLRADVAGDANTVYVYGHDAIAQAREGADPNYFLCDGHGSVRHLATSAGAITQNYNYDGYGNAHGFNPANAATSLLYTGEMYDTYLQHYYLRARWYNPANGRFNRMDPFGGNNQDPQSLHKYLYCHANPVNGMDPTGQAWTYSEVLSVAQIAATIATIVVPAVLGLVGMGFAGYYHMAGEPDAWVVSLSAAALTSLGFLLWGMGFGVELTYEFLYIKALGRFQDYWSWGPSCGFAGGAAGATAAIEYGAIFNVEEVGDYEGLFFSATGGVAPWAGSLFPGFTGLTQWGGVLSYFWAPSRARNSTGEFACGFKGGGPAWSSGLYIYGGTMSFYHAGGPYSWSRDLLDWFNVNITPPTSSDPVQGAMQLRDEVTDKLGI